MRVKNLIRRIRSVKRRNISNQILREINVRSSLVYSDKNSKNYIRALKAYEVNISDLDSAKIKELLATKGIFYVKGSLPKELLDKLNREIDVFFRGLDMEDGRKNGYFVQKRRLVYTSYKELVKAPLPVVTVRKGRDDGMIDIFNFDRLLSKDLQGLISESLQVISSFFDSHFDMVLQNYNLYFNKGVDQTRGFHIDDMSHTLKAFIYLDDVFRFEDGPYVYCPGTHVDKELLEINASLSSYLEHKSDAPFLFDRLPLPVFAEQGSMIVSDQTGIHRGHPQGLDGSRKILVLRFIKKQL